MTKGLLTVLAIFTTSYIPLLFTRELPKYESNRESKIWKRVATADRNKLWEEGVLPYEISTNCSENLQRTIHRAMKEWESKTCIKFVRAEPDHKYRIIIKNEGSCGCCSGVGKVEEKQEATFHENCNSLSVIMHELGHAIGFHHEQNRPDRDKYVKVIFENIKKGHENNFKKLNEDEADTLGFGYDFYSIMHYQSTTFGINRKESIHSLKKGVSLRERRVKLSQTDIAATNKLYNCPKCYITSNQKIGHISLSEESLARKEGYCEWFINRNPGEFIEFYVKDLDIPESNNCSTDYLQIQDGYWSKSPVIERVCGKRNTKVFYLTKTNNVRIIYKSSSLQNEGSNFYIGYRVICNRTITAHRGDIQSPEFDQPYLYDSVCQWAIVVPDGYKVALSFNTFHIVYNDNCESDYIEVVDGGLSANPLLTRFCGNKLPNAILSTSESLIVRFVSKIRDVRSHFSATFTEEINECEFPDKGGCVGKCINTYGSYYCECDDGMFWFNNSRRCEKIVDICEGTFETSEKAVIVSPSFPNLYPKHVNCFWNVPNRKVRLTFLHMDIAAASYNYCFDKLIIKSKKYKKTYCGSEAPNPLVFQSGVKIQFITNNVNEKPGFALLMEPF